MVNDPPVPPARPRPGLLSNILLPGVALLVLVADLASKVWVQRHFTDGCDYNSQTIVPDWLSLTYTCNQGAAFGLLARETLLFVLIALVVVGVIVAYFRYLPANRPWLRLSLGLQLGGALGNLIDRLRQGYVVDFISIKSLPVFNLADTCIVVGVLILAYHLLVTQERTPTPVSRPPSALHERQGPDG